MGLALGCSRWPVGGICSSMSMGEAIRAGGRPLGRYGVTGLLALLVVGRNAWAQPVPDASGDGTHAPQMPRERPFRPSVAQWKQVMASPRIGGRLTALAVDPSDPRHVVVGTEEGTVLVTEDGGVTWREVEIGPFVFQARQARARVPGLPRLGERLPLGFTFFTDPPYRARPPDRVLVPMHNLFFSVSPDFISVGAAPKVGRAPATLLRDAVAEDRARAVPVRNFAFCPGSAYPLLMTTSREVLGSADGGLTWVRLTRFPGRVVVYWLACSKRRPGLVLLGTAFGLFLSEDGGLSWDQESSGWPGRPAQAVAFVPDGEGGERALAGVSYILFSGKLGGGLRRVYPDFRDTSTAPWRAIRWIEAAPSGSLWLGTDDGLRFASRLGARWRVAGRGLFDRHEVHQVVSGFDERGGERIVVLVRDCSAGARRCRGTRLYASDDGGRRWFPFFEGFSRRSIAQVAVSRSAVGGGSRWWLVAGGELWSTEDPSERLVGAPDAASARWARRRLRATPPLDVVQETALRRLGLDLDGEEGLFRRARRRAWLPVVEAQLALGQVPSPSGTALEQVGGHPRARRWVLGRRVRETVVRAPEPPFSVVEQRSDRLGQREVFFFVQALWRLGDTGFSVQEGGLDRSRLYALRRHVSFVVEDAWHERVLHLRRLVRGVTDPWQAASLRARVEALEAILEIWADVGLQELAERNEGER